MKGGYQCTKLNQQQRCTKDKENMREGGYQCIKLNQQQRCTKDKENLREGPSNATKPVEASRSAAVRVGKTAPPGRLGSHKQQNKATGQARTMLSMKPNQLNRCEQTL